MVAGMSRTLDAEIASLAIPASLALMTDPLYDLSDTAILGHLGTAELAGAALAIQVLSFGYALFIFLMFATTASVARWRGSGREDLAVQHAVDATWLGLALGVAGMAVFATIGRWCIAALGGTGEVAEHAWTYMSISIAGLPAFTIVLVGVGYLRGSGRARTPLVVAAGSVALNLVLEIVAIYGFGFGVGASALGTVVAKWTSALVYVAIMVRSQRRHRSNWRPRVRPMVAQLHVGRDLVLRTVLLLGVLTTAQAMAARLGVQSLAAHTIAFRIWMFTAYASDGVEAAGQTMVAHRLGSGDVDAIRAVVQRLLGWALVLGMTMAIAIGAGSGALPRIFSDDAALVAAAATTLLWVAVLQPFNAIAFALDGMLVGAAEQTFLAKAMAVSAIAFTATALLTHRLELGLNGIWLSISIFMLVRAGLGLWRVALGGIGTPRPTALRAV